jgi:hypothetical protein
MADVAEEGQSQEKDRYDEEGDPNLVPFRNSKDGPVLEWARARDLSVGDRVLLSNRFIWTIGAVDGQSGESAPLSLVLVEPTYSVVRDKPEVGPTMPRRLEHHVSGAFLYRRLT